MGEQESKRAKKHICAGLLAHVDAGKTTLAEQLLYQTGSIKTPGRVDDKTTVLDYNEIEKRRGITVFLGQASFSYQGEDYYLLDTPGHVDFSAEMERSLKVLDLAIVVISLVEGVQGHTITVFKYLKELKIPSVFFLNKQDREGADVKGVIGQIRNKLTKKAILLSNFPTQIDWNLILEQAAEENDTLLELYLSGEAEPMRISDEIWKQVSNAEIIPCICGSALKQQGIEELLEMIHCIRLKLETKAERKTSSMAVFKSDKGKAEDNEDIQNKDVQNKNGRKEEEENKTEEEETFAGFVYKIRRDEKGMRVAYIKVTKGVLSVKDEVEIHTPSKAFVKEKVDQIRFYSGLKYQVVSKVQEGDICGVIGLDSAVTGSGLGAYKQSETYAVTPILRAKVMITKEITKTKMLEALRILEDEDPMLKIVYEESLEQILVHIMGEVQLEVLQETLWERFGLKAEFGVCEVQYLETIKKPVMGYGHFEPLRHYAEVHLKIEPGERGSGIKAVSACRDDILKQNFQHLILTHILEKEHKGILLGAPLTDVLITVVNGRAHLKHTEGGDFREATYRAVRQGLEKADNVILEPIYKVIATVSEEISGRIISDIKKRYGTVSEIESIEKETQIIGRCPVSEMLEYPKEFLMFTKGKGSLQLIPDGYDICHNSEDVIQTVSYEKERDIENSSSSVFCSHGSGFLVPWQEAENYMHCPIAEL